MSFQTSSKRLEDSKSGDLKEESVDIHSSKYYEHVATSNVDYPEKSKVMC
jgi:hypothetical protein